jgi:hypothetical protein
MSWTNNPEIRDLEPYSKKHKFKAVVLIGFRGDGRFTVNSFGQNKSLCKLAEKVNDAVAEALEIGYIKVPESLN